MAKSFSIRTLLWLIAITAAWCSGYCVRPNPDCYIQADESGMNVSLWVVQGNHKWRFSLNAKGGPGWASVIIHDRNGPRTDPHFWRAAEQGVYWASPGARP